MRRRILVGSILLVISLGCSLDKPASPTFETRLFFPMGERTTSGLDLMHGSAYIRGDSTGADPLSVVIRGDLSEFQVGSALDVEQPGASFSAGLPSIEITPPASRTEEFLLSSLQGAPPPGNSGPAVAFDFSAGPAEIQPVDTFEWVHFASGTLRIQVQNNLPVGMGTAQDTSVVVSVNDAATHDPLLRLSYLGAIAARGTARLEANLAGKAIGRRLELQVRGKSPGSQGQVVQLAPEDGVRLQVSFLHLTADSALAVVPSQEVSVEEGISLPADVRLERGEILDGSLPLTLSHRLPLPVTVTVTLPELYRGGQPFPAQTVRLAAAGAVPVQAGLNISLAGATIQAPGSDLLDRLHYRVDAVTDGATSPVALGLHQRAEGGFGSGTIRFQSIRGLLDHRTVEIAPTEKDLDLPEGIDQLDFENATLTLVVESAVGLASDAQVELAAVPRSGGTRISMPLEFALPVPPEGQTMRRAYSWDRNNSNILDLIRSRPQGLMISGSLDVGGSGELGTIRRGDLVRGSYTLMAPLKVQIRSVSYKADPFSFTVSDDQQKQILDHFGQGVFHGRVENHFPAELVVHLAFAGRAEDLPDHPEVVLDSVRVAAGATDAQGRVTQATATDFDLAITDHDVPFFARDQVFGQVVFQVRGEDPEKYVLVTALDYASVRGMMEFSVRVKP